MTEPYLSEVLAAEAAEAADDARHASLADEITKDYFERMAALAAARAVLPLVGYRRDVLADALLVAEVTVRGISGEPAYRLAREVAEDACDNAAPGTSRHYAARAVWAAGKAASERNPAEWAISAREWADAAKEAARAGR